MTDERLAMMKGAAAHARQRLAPGDRGNKVLGDIEELLAEVDRLRARVAELEPDAARLDWYEATARNESEPGTQQYLNIWRQAESMPLRVAIDREAGKEATWLS